MACPGLPDRPGLPYRTDLLPMPGLLQVATRIASRGRPVTTQNIEQRDEIMNFSTSAGWLVINAQWYPLLRVLFLFLSVLQNTHFTDKNSDTYKKVHSYFSCLKLTWQILDTASFEFMENNFGSIDKGISVSGPWTPYHTISIQYSMKTNL